MLLSQRPLALTTWNGTPRGRYSRVEQTWIVVGSCVETFFVDPFEEDVASHRVVTLSILVGE